jgi:DNA-binding CsgD family transcriptional regulator
MRRFFAFITLHMLFCMTHLLFSQEIHVGKPLSSHFVVDTYQGGTQNWGFTQDSLGRLFVANNDGLMIYDGLQWSVLPLPNRTILRSVEVGPSGKVYVGGQGVLGYFSENAYGTWVFQSLNESIPQTDRSFGDVWDIAIYQGDTYFRTTDKIFQYKQGEIRTVHRSDITYCLRTIENELFLHERKNGLLHLDGETFLPVAEKAILPNTEITEVLPLDSTALLIVSLEKGLFVLEKGEIRSFNTPFPDFFLQNELLSASRLTKEQFAIGTADAGLVIIRSDGKVRYQLDKQGGLQNSRVRSLFTDHAGNLWAGLENGIDMIHTRSPFKYFYPDGNLESPAYAVKIVDNQLYVGMASGLFYSSWQNAHSPFEGKSFAKVKGSEGQVWGLQSIENELYMGHHEGAFRIRDGRMQAMGSLQGVWGFKQMQLDDEVKIIAGHYTGLSEFEVPNSQWQRLGDFNESSRFIEQDIEGRIWISHPYRGVYRFDQGSGPVLYGKAAGLPSDNFNHIFNIHGEMVVVGERGVFSYDKSTDSFIAHPIYHNLFNEEERVIRLVEAPSGNVWFVTDKATGLIEVIDKGIERTFQKRVYTEIHGKLVAGFEHIYPHDDHNVFFAATKGLIHLDPSIKVRPDSSWRVWLKTVHILPQDSLSLIHSRAEIQYPSDVHSLRFSCAASSFEEPKKLKFRFRLVGLDDMWSSWTSSPSKEYNNLTSGKYSFEFQAQSAAGLIQYGEPFSFYIAPPWYASNTAIGVYALLGLAALMAMIYVPQRAFKKEKAYLQTIHKRKVASHQRELEQTEQALANLEKERLQDEVRFKTTELASTTMHLVQKNQLLMKLNSELEQLRKKAKNPEVATELRKLIRLLKHDIRLDDDWEQFSHHFDQVHRDFVSRLIDTHPQLTPNDHRLCAYLRMNLSSKEIAPLMNITVRGVEVSRYRLRKKLSLASEVNLTEFMMRF